MLRFVVHKIFSVELLSVHKNSLYITILIKGRKFSFRQVPSPDECLEIPALLGCFSDCIQQ